MRPAQPEANACQPTKEAIQIQDVVLCSIEDSMYSGWCPFAWRQIAHVRIATSLPYTMGNIRVRRRAIQVAVRCQDSKFEFVTKPRRQI